MGLYVTNTNYLVTFGYQKHIADKKDAITMQDFDYLTNSYQIAFRLKGNAIYQLTSGGRIEKKQLKV